MKQLGDQYIDYCVSSGTCKTDDPLTACLRFLDSVKNDCDCVQEVKDLENASNVVLSDDDERYVLDEAFTLMNDIAPRTTVFGAHDGDGAAFGFWTVEGDWDDLDDEYK